MSLFGKSNDLNREFIARPDAAKEDILFKWPDMTIRKFTQVTVEPDETALFFKEGKVAGALPQGRSTLDGALIPFLGDIVDFASGGNMYRAELYFVGTREFVSLPFGGPIDNIEDPETGLAVGLRVFGEDALSISDPAALILKHERWTFARSAAARTPVAGGVTASRCPACGAELQLSLDGTCAHCRASVTNGTVDWVVADIQNAEFVGYSGDASFAAAAPTIADGVVTLRAADPGFVLEAFQARVKTAFLTLQEAWCQQHLDAGRAFLSPGAYFTWRAQLETLATEGRRNVMENIEVRSVEPVQIVHGRVFDDLTVRISASAVDYDVDKDGKVVFGDRTSRPFTEDWTFQRSVGVATLAKPGTLENTCPSCGAPVSLNQVGECRFCKAAVTSGKFDWVVSRIEQDDAITSNNSAIGNVGEDLALQLGGAIVGGLLGSLLSGNGTHESRK